MSTTPTHLKRYGYIIGGLILLGVVAFLFDLVVDLYAMGEPKLAETLGFLCGLVFLELAVSVFFGKRTLLVFNQILGGIALVVLTNVLLAAADFRALAVIEDGIFLGSLWLIYAFLRYRQNRQEELAQVLAAAVSGGAPLAPAVQSYCNDRPQRSRLSSIFAGLAIVFLPLYTYVRICIGWRGYDRLVEDLAGRLEAGRPLSQAFREVPGVASRELRLAAAVGEATGSLGPCLQTAMRERSAAAWFEIVPRLIYPAAILFFVAFIATFLAVAIIPKFKKIFDEFGLTLPSPTQRMIEVFTYIGEYAWIFTFALWGGLLGVSMVVANPTVRWHTPFLGRLYRWGVQAEVLRTLGRLLTAGQTVPQSLAFLRDSSDLPNVARRRLAEAASRVERGEPLDEVLGRSDLLPESMVPLVRAAQRAHTLPWALSELGDHLAGRAFRLVRRVSLIAAPLMIVAVGAVVGFLVIGMFLPLIKLISGMSV